MVWLLSGVFQLRMRLLPLRVFVFSASELVVRLG